MNKCTAERLVPTRWICRKSCQPDRAEMAAHLRGLRLEYGWKTAKACIREMLWTGIYPVRVLK